MCCKKNPANADKYDNDDMIMMITMAFLFRLAFIGSINRLVAFIYTC